MNSIYFIVDGKVQPKQRPKVFRNKYSGKSHGVTPEKTREYEERVRGAYIDACIESEGKEVEFEGAIEMIVNIYIEIPKNVAKKYREPMLLGLVRPISKTGDVDNLFKAISDSLNGVAYHDDSQIVTAKIQKFYGKEARAEIIIKEWLP